jgi:hypothetical protein
MVGGARAYDTSSLFDIWRGHGVIRDPMTGEPRYPIDNQQVVGKWLGLSTFDINTAEYAAMERENSIAALRAWLRRYGYIPPSQTSSTSYAPPATVSTTTHYGGLT